MAASLRQFRKISGLPAILQEVAVVSRSHHRHPQSQRQERYFSFTSKKLKGLVLGVYEPTEKDGEVILSKAAEAFNSRCTGKLNEQIKLCGKGLKKGKSRILYGLDPEFSSVAVTCVGKQLEGYSELEQLDKGRENVRAAAANGVRQLREVGEKEVDVDPCGDPEASAEGSHLSLFTYDEYKAEDKRKAKVSLQCYTDYMSNRDGPEEQWKRGTILAEAQNFARQLMESPANKMSPSIFADTVSQKLSASGKCTVTVRDQTWAESQKMGAFLSVSKGSQEPLAFLEIDYKGDGEDTPPMALVGKGVTFDSGGISIKPAANMDQMRADMGGAACVVGTLLACARLHLPVHIKGFIPLCENMPSGSAVKPGDVVTAMNGKTIQVDNTDAEGRLILADALCYAETFKPQFIMDMATLTGAMDVALGSGATGVFTNSTSLWEDLLKAGSRTGDRVWRMPLFDHYTRQVTESQLADLNNIGKHARSGGACTAAAFLKEFVSTSSWLHLDIAGVMGNKDEVPYLGKGMAGRPTRTVVEFIHRLSSKALKT